MGKSVTSDEGWLKHRLDPLLATKGPALTGKDTGAGLAASVGDRNVRFMITRHYLSVRCFPDFAERNRS
jgi:hypothetical protein